MLLGGLFAPCVLVVLGGGCDKGRIFSVERTTTYTKISLKLLIVGFVFYHVVYKTVFLNLSLYLQAGMLPMSLLL